MVKNSSESVEVCAAAVDFGVESVEVCAGVVEVSIGVVEDSLERFGVGLASVLAD